MKTRHRTNIIDKNLHKLNKLIKDGKTNWENIDELADELNINRGSFKRYRGRLLELNFKFNTRKDTLHKNRHKLLKLLVEGKNKWDSYKALEEEIGASKGKLYKFKDELNAMGFIFKDLYKNPIIVNFKKLYRLLEEGRYTWKTTKELTYNVNPGSNLYKYRKELKKMGFIFTNSPTNTMEKYSDILLKLLEKGSNKWPSPYALEKEIADGSNIRKKRIELENMGFEFKSNILKDETA